MKKVYVCGIPIALRSYSSVCEGVWSVKFLLPPVWSVCTRLCLPLLLCSSQVLAWRPMSQTTSWTCPAYMKDSPTVSPQIHIFHGSIRLVTYRNTCPGSGQTRKASTTCDEFEFMLLSLCMVELTSQGTTLDLSLSPLDLLQISHYWNRHCCRMIVKYTFWKTMLDSLTNIFQQRYNYLTTYNYLILGQSTTTTTAQTVYCRFNR